MTPAYVVIVSPNIMKNNPETCNETGFFTGSYFLANNLKDAYKKAEILAKFFPGKEVHILVSTSRMFCPTGEVQVGEFNSRGEYVG